MKLTLTLILIAVIAVVIIDMSGLVPAVRGAVARFLTKHGRPTDAENVRLKPFDCSFCMTFWVGLGFLLGTRSFSVGALAVLCLVALSTVIIDDALRMVLDASAALFRWIGSKINKSE